MEQEKKSGFGGFDNTNSLGFGFGNQSKTKSFQKAIKVKKRVMTTRHICPICHRDDCQDSHDVTVYDEDKNAPEDLI